MSNCLKILLSGSRKECLLSGWVKNQDLKQFAVPGLAELQTKGWEDQVLDFFSLFTFFGESECFLKINLVSINISPIK